MQERRTRGRSAAQSAGSSAPTTVPPPGGLDTASRPPRASTRSARPCSPVPRPGSAPPTPSSVISIDDVGAAAAQRGSPPPRPARAWPTLASASDATKYAANSTGRGSRGPSRRPAGVGTRRAQGQRLQRDSRPCSSAAGWMPRASSRSSASDCGELVARGGHELLGVPRVVADPPLDQRELQGERDQPLLGAVVQVALDAAPLGVGGGDDALARGLQLGQPRVDLGVQLPVLQRDPGRHADGLDELGVVVERPVVDQHGDRAPRRGPPASTARPAPPRAARPDGRRRRRSRRRAGRRSRTPGSPSTRASAACSSAGPHRAQLAEQVGEPAAGQPRPQQPGEERERHRACEQAATHSRISASRPRRTSSTASIAANSSRQSRARHARAASPAGPACGRARQRAAEHGGGADRDRDEQRPLQGVDGAGHLRRRDDEQQGGRVLGEHQPQRGEHDHLEPDGGRPAPGPPGCAADRRCRRSAAAGRRTAPTGPESTAPTVWATASRDRGSSGGQQEREAGGRHEQAAAVVRPAAARRPARRRRTSRRSAAGRTSTGSIGTSAEHDGREHAELGHGGRGTQSTTQSPRRRTARRTRRPARPRPRRRAAATASPAIAPADRRRPAAAAGRLAGRL